MSTTGNRLREERQRLGKTQLSFAVLCGVRKRAQINYEQDKRKPDSAYLEAVAAAGADVTYVLTGRRMGVAPATLPTAHQSLCAAFDRATLDGVQLLGLAAKCADHPTKARAAYGALLLVESLL
ncbi:XRE family transcriptional regulator [bacterium]|nr:MAG: XRE family transcriptional regulator [bacterium]